ncbi:MAG: hypothetical protein CVU11_14525 [Bacteroidetes bacterium HGW-Bacteroidetes-6]|jgi:DNA-binding CsgD family transcriptional regulator|nr:MAG: hypothetical protein CVU11_14525 [Bacteroidetes bacterium HGW-Bacteroidetes-6]
MKNFGSCAFILLITLISVSSCNRQTDSNDKLDNKMPGSDSLLKCLIDTGTFYFGKGEYQNSFIALEKAEKLIPFSNDTSMRIRLLFNKTELLKIQGDYNSCMKNYFEAAFLAKVSQDSFRLALAYYNISATFAAMKEYKQAERYNAISIQIFNTIGDSSRLMNCCVQACAIKRNLSDFHSALKYITQAIKYYEKHDSKQYLAMSLNNYANLLLDNDEFGKAKEMYKRSATISQQLGDEKGYAVKLGNIGETFLNLNQPDSAKFYIDSSLSIATKIGDAETKLFNHERLLRYYKMIGNAESALEIMDLVLKERTEMLKLESSETIEGIENQYQREIDLLGAKNRVEILEKDQLLQQRAREKENQIWVFLLSLLAIISATLFVIYRKQKRIRAINDELHLREKQILESENLLTISELNIKEHEKKQLEAELDFKRQELINLSLFLTEREQLLENVENVLSNYKYNDDPAKSLVELRNQIGKTSQSEINKLYLRIEELNSSFFFKLKSQYPTLNDDDLRMATLILLGFSAKEVAKMLFIEPKSVDMKRYRLKKKLNIGVDSDLKEFFRNI